jgi:hypothetical protein
MRRGTFPTRFRPAEGRVLRGPVPSCFEAFYRAELRYRSGGRLRSLELARRYAAWAAANEAPSLNLQELRRAMLNIGHRHFRSNNIYFGDVQLAVEVPSLADNFPGLPIDPPIDAGPDPMVAQIDRILAELHLLRARAEAA